MTAEHDKRRDLWIENEANFGDVFNIRKPVLSYLPADHKEKTPTGFDRFIHVREVRPGEITLTLQEFQAFCKRAWGNHYPPMMYALERQLFPEGSEGVTK